MKRDEILKTASDLIDGARDEVYGSALDNFTRIGKLWEQVLGVPVSPAQVALCMNQVKVSRLINSPDHVDGWVDGSGYLALGGEIATALPEINLTSVHYAAVNYIEPEDWVEGLFGIKREPRIVPSLSTQDSYAQWRDILGHLYRWNCDAQYNDPYGWERLSAGGWTPGWRADEGFGPFTEVVECRTVPRVVKKLTPDCADAKWAGSDGTIYRFSDGAWEFDSAMQGWWIECSDPAPGPNYADFFTEVIE